MRILRGHHLLCVHGFQGFGYSPSFIQKMEEIVSEVRNEQLHFPIRVVTELDDACSACPHRRDGYCGAGEGSEKHVMGMDRKVIAHLGLEAGKTYSKKELIARTIERVKPEDLELLCDGCSWLRYGVCKEGIARLREK